MGTLSGTSTTNPRVVKDMDLGALHAGFGDVPSNLCMLFWLMVPANPAAGKKASLQLLALLLALLAKDRIPRLDALHSE